MSWADLVSRVPVPSLLFATAATAATLVLVEQRFGVPLDIESGRFWVVAVGSFAFWLLVAHVAGLGRARFRRWRKTRAIHREHERRIEAMHPVHRQHLAEFVLEHRQTVPLMSIADGVHDLENWGVIRRGSSTSFRGYHFMYTLADWAWETLQRRPGLVALELRELVERRQRGG